MQTHYEVLGVEPIAETDAIRAAYRQKSFELHPDVAPGNEAQFLAVRDAYEVLKSEKSRREYDAVLRLTLGVCPTCDGKGVTYKQQGFTNRISVQCSACGGRGFK